MRLRVFGRDFRLMSMLLNLAVDLLFHVSINDNWQVVATSQSVRQAGRQLSYIFMYQPITCSLLVETSQ